MQKMKDTELITAANVPQFSRLESAYKVPEVLCALDEWLTFEQLGVYLDNTSGKKETANKKYGENHAKLATLLDLADIMPASPLRIVVTPFSVLFTQLSQDEQEAFAARLAFRIPVIRQILVDAAAHEVSVTNYLKPFSDSTKKRRLPNIRTILGLISNHISSEDEDLLISMSNVRF